MDGNSSGMEHLGEDEEEDEEKCSRKGQVWWRFRWIEGDYQDEKVA